MGRGISCHGEEPKTSRGCSRGTWGRIQGGMCCMEVLGWCWDGARPWCMEPCTTAVNTAWPKIPSLACWSLKS